MHHEWNPVKCAIRCRTPWQPYLEPRCCSAAHASAQGISTPEAAGGGIAALSARTGARRGEAASAAAIPSNGGALSALACSRAAVVATELGLGS